MFFQRQLIADCEVGLMGGPKGFEKILEAGRYILPSQKTIQRCNLSDFPANVPNLERLFSIHSAALAPHLEIVRTDIDEVVMVRAGQQYHFVLPGSLQAFWKQYIPVEIQRTTVSSDLKVPDEWVARMPVGVSISCVKQVSIPAGAYGMLFVEDAFCDFLLPGRHAYFDVRPKTRLVICKQGQVIEAREVVLSVLESGHSALTDHLTIVETDSKQLTLWWDGKQLMQVSPPATRALASRALNAELISLEQIPRLVEEHIVVAMRSSQNAAQLLSPHVTNYEIPSEHVGMFHVDGVFMSILSPGFYAYWHGGRRLSLTMIDTRLAVLEVAGQEMLTQDKVQLRVNVTAGYKIVDGRLVLSSLNDYKDFIYKEIQFALRAAIGSKTLDGLLENKNETDEQILSYMQRKVAVSGIDMISLGIKDLILPGEIKAILGKVVEAEKAAQANVIRRREETAATRSLMNTAKVMEDNPVALRLKELETLEKITEKIEHLSVYGGLEGLLKQLVPFKSLPEN